MGNNAFHVLQLSTSRAANYMGGPALTMRLLLKANEAAGADRPAMSAVFSDRGVSSYRDFDRLAPEDKTIRGGLFLLARLLMLTIGFSFRFFKAIRKTDPEKSVLHAHGVTPAYLCSWLFGRKRPLLLTFHGKGGHVREPLRQYRGLRFAERFLRHVETRAVKRANVTCFTSRGAYELFSSEYPQLLRDKDVRIVYTGVDLPELDAVRVEANLLKKCGAPPGSFVVLCIAKLIEDKGVDTLIEAIARLPEKVRSRLSCLIVGRGQMEAELKSLINRKALQDRIKLPGFLPRGQLLGLMKSVDLFVLPSRVSVFDYALLEAGAMKLPIITTAIGGNLEMFDGESAILVPPDDPRTLVESIANIAADPALKKRLAENAYQRIRSRFSLESMFASYLNIYKEMLGLDERDSAEESRALSGVSN